MTIETQQPKMLRKVRKYGGEIGKLLKCWWKCQITQSLWRKVQDSSKH
jgi:hypothetical protein